jgi:hypothetical protein
MSPGQLLYHHRRGKTLDQLAEMSGLSRYQVHRRITAERWRAGEVVITERKLRQCVSSGMTVRQMADKFFCSTGCVSKKIKQYGIKMRQPGNPNWCEHSEKD